MYILHDHRSHLDKHGGIKIIFIFLTSTRKVTKMTTCEGTGWDLFLADGVLG